MLRAAAPSNNGWAKWDPQENLSFADSRGFALGGPDRRAEDAGELTIFLDELFDQCGRGHPSFQNDEEPDAGLIELFDGDSEFMYEVRTALPPPALRRSSEREKCPNAGSGRKHDARQRFSASARPVQ